MATKSGIKSLRLKYQKKSIAAGMLDRIARSDEPLDVKVAMIKDLLAESGRDISHEDAEWAVRKCLRFGDSFGYELINGLFPDEKSVGRVIDFIVGRDLMDTSRHSLNFVMDHLEDSYLSSYRNMFCPSVINKIRDAVCSKLGLSV